MKRLKLVLLLSIALLPISNIKSETKEFETGTITFSAAPLNDTSALRSLSIEGVDFKFNPDVLDYKFDVPYSMSSLKLHYEANVKDSIVEVVGGEELFLGNNSIAIIVTSGYDGSTREYDLTVIRKNDTVEVEDNSDSIETALKSDKGSSVIVNTDGDAKTLSKSTSSVLKDSLKTLVYNWIGSNGRFLESLTIDGSKIANMDAIVPKIKKSITDEKLLKYVEGFDYTPLSTKGTNLPRGSIYKVAIEGKEDIYYLYYYENGTLNKKPLRNMNGTVEFEVEEGYDYALMVSTADPNKNLAKEGMSWIWPSILVTLLVIIIFLITKFILVRVLRTPSIPKDEEDKE